MAEADRRRWNTRHAERRADFTPAASLLAYGSLLRPRRADARALDLACGAGRNALYLAELGYQVDAWDISEVALEALRTEAARREAAGQWLRILGRQVDLERAASEQADLAIPPERYDLLIDYYYLERSLFPAMAASLRPGGLLLVETFLDAGPAREHVANPAYLLAPGELRRAFAGLAVLDASEDADQSIARLLARRAALPDPAGAPS